MAMAMSSHDPARRTMNKIDVVGWIVDWRGSKMKTFRVEMKSVCFITLPSCLVAYNSWLLLSLSVVARELD